MVRPFSELSRKQQIDTQHFTTLLLFTGNDCYHIKLKYKIDHHKCYELLGTSFITRLIIGTHTNTHRAINSLLKVCGTYFPFFAEIENDFFLRNTLCKGFLILLTFFKQTVIF